MEIKLDIDEIKDLLDEQDLTKLPGYTQLDEPDTVYKDQYATKLIESLVDAYSGNGWLIIPLDDEAKELILKECQLWEKRRRDIIMERIEAWEKSKDSAR